MKRNSILILALTLLFAIPMMAENGMNSPYTRYGFGQLASMETGTNKGMGGTGIGVQGSNQINMLNPASYAAIDTLTFLLDVGMSLQNANFSENGVKMNARNTTFDYLAMQFRLMPHLGFTLGMMPFSNIGYNFSNTISKNEDGTQTATLLYNGTGGLRQVTAGIGYAPIKGLSFTAAALYQYQYGSAGFDGTSNTYQRNALVPELFVGMTSKGKHLTGGWGVSASTIAPRVIVNNMRVDERLTSYSAMVFGSLKIDALSVRAKATYGQNTSHMQQPTGFCVVETFDNGVQNYEPMQLGSAWITMMYGKKLRYGFFAGWLKNYGSAGKDYTSLVVRNNKGMDEAYRFSPIVTYKVENMQVDLEYEHTATAYGDYQPSGMVTNTHWVANNRVCVMVKYDF